MNLPSLDAYLTNAPDPGSVPDHVCECGAELLAHEGRYCLTCEEAIDLGRLDGPDYEDVA